MSHDGEYDEKSGIGSTRLARSALVALVLAVAGAALLWGGKDDDRGAVVGRPGAAGFQVLATSWGEVGAADSGPAETPAEAEPEDANDPQVVLRRNLQNLDVMIESRR